MYNKHIDVFIFIIHLITYLKWDVFIAAHNHELIFEDYKGDYDPVCEGPNDGKIYLLEGHFVKVSEYHDEYIYSFPHIIFIESCRNITVLDNSPVFDRESMLKTVTNLVLGRVKNWKSLDYSKLRRVVLYDFTPVNAWGDCNFVKELVIVHPNLALAPPDWLSACDKIKELTLKRLTVIQVQALLNTGLRTKILKIESVFDIDRIIQFPIFPMPRSFHHEINAIMLNNIHMSPETKHISSAEMSTILVWQISLLKSLFSLYINVDFFDFCAPGNQSSVKFPVLLYIWFERTNTSRTCFKSLRLLPRLQRISFNNNHLIDLNIDDLLPFVYLNPIEIYFDELDNLIFTHEDFTKLAKFFEIDKQIILHIKSSVIRINCDCAQSLWTARALQERFITGDIRCKDNSRIEDQLCEKLQCHRVICNSSCLCCRDENYTIFADCRDVNLSVFPKDLIELDNLTELVIPNNHISSLPYSWSRNLSRVDLSRNNLFGHTKLENLKNMFKALKHVRLSGNPVICSCENQNILEELQQNRRKIEDYDHIACENNTLLVNINIAELCIPREREERLLREQKLALTIVVPITLILSITVLILGVIFYYRRQLKVFLYARGWCLCCLREEELDADKSFDVFLSFCHEDSDLVFDNLLPVLDRDYLVCIHTRNWYPGESIPTQITRSVDQSRRTLIVLSRSFVKSVWGLLEFRTAHGSALMEGRVRVVMIVIDDVLEQPDLIGEVKSYVRLNTYVKWEDPWLWEKLRYALPHRPAKIMSSSNIQPSHTEVSLPISLHNIVDNRQQFVTS